MKIISTNIENLAENKKALYKLTKTPGVNVKDIEQGKSHGVSAYALYTEVKGDGAEQEVLAVILDSGEKLQTISPTFIKAFMEIVEIMGNDSFSIITHKNTSKSGREFVNCELDCD